MSEITNEEINIAVTTNNNVTNMDVIWPSTDTLPNFNNEVRCDFMVSYGHLRYFNSQACLPVIGSCQVSSILSTLENVPKETPVLEYGDSFKSIAFNVCNEGNIAEHKRKKKKENVVLLEKKQLYQEMVFFGCNFCPFICTKDSKISDHINTVHKNQEDNHRTKLKCPGCTNVFYHTLSLRSHLIHDHEVCKGDINKIVNGIVYVSTLANSEKNKKDVENGKKIEAEQMDFLNETVSSDDEAHDLDEPEDETGNNNEVPEAIVVNDEKLEGGILNEVLNGNTPEITEEATPVVEDKKLQKCVIATCAVRMRDVTNMAYHVRSHYGKIFNCIECGEKFSVWRTLQTHLWRHHKMDMELYSCDKCEYKTYSLAKLNNVHRLIHGEEKPFLCDFCGKGFKNPKQLRNHKIVHKMKPVELQHQCEVCQRMFSDRRQLRVHMNSVHQKIKPFSCNYCGYKAASNGALRLHVRQHTGEKPFACDLCEYTTSDHNSLRRHKSRHSGIKKYKCAHCDYACIQSSTYKTHLKTKHPGLENGLMFSCHACQFRTISKDKYMIHITTHKEKPKKTTKKPISTEIIPLATPITNDCIILPLEGDIAQELSDPLQATETTEPQIVPNNVQYIYSGTGVVVEVTNTKEKT